MENLPDQLINSDCPSIEYRTRREILKENLSDNEVNEYQQKILSRPKGCQILEWQNDDGYFGTRLHTAPTGSIIHPINSEYNEQYGFWWFHFHELAARMGMLSEKSPFRKKFDLIDDMQLERIAGNIKRADQRKAYTGWGAYSGLALNDDWKSMQNRISDLMFRICLTRHYGDR